MAKYFLTPEYKGILYTYNATIVRVIDGDTIEVDVDLGFKTWIRKTLRFARYNAPETRGVNKSDAGVITKNRMVELLTPGKTVKIISVKYEDKYGRFLGEVIDGDVNIGDKLFAEGLVKKYGETA